MLVAASRAAAAGISPGAVSAAPRPTGRRSPLSAVCSTGRPVPARSLAGAIGPPHKRGEWWRADSPRDSKRQNATRSGLYTKLTCAQIFDPVRSDATCTPARHPAWVAGRFLSTQPLGSLTTLWRFAHDADAGVGKMGVWLLSTSWCWHRRDARADMLCDPTGRCCGPSLAHVVDTPHGGAIAVKSSTGPRWPSIAGC